ncbi:hypothetical protein MasN3_38040 [Massilia varians]|uniref:Uncharacterized protein n=1 Tax=Massilia varians TaxID=457921 RepID=A0ABM8CAK1_9BURK|nr:hypothetical protein [Massilia varians]BDT60310.1 hypothetical protein MasN3_38040 [Massilia varians]
MSIAAGVPVAGILALAYTVLSCAFADMAVKAAVASKKVRKQIFMASPVIVDIEHDPAV